MIIDKALNLAAIRHIVHDWSNLLAAGQQTSEPHKNPINHFIQHAFLVECRKFGDFFHNHRGQGDMVSKNYVGGTRFKPKLHKWDEWGDHMDKHLMHLSYLRVTNDRPWKGDVNRIFLAEFQKAWNEFIGKLNPDYEAEFKKQLLNYEV